MDRKKLLTVACAIAVLAFGACFGPGPPATPPSAPTLPFAPIRSIAIQIRDLSGGIPVDVDSLSRALAANCNKFLKDQKLHAHAMQTSKPGEATLAISLLRKSESCAPSDLDQQKCDFELFTAAILSTQDGYVVWRQSGAETKGAVWVPAGATAEFWKSDLFIQHAADSLRTAIVPGMMEAERVKRL